MMIRSMLLIGVVVLGGVSSSLADDPRTPRVEQFESGVIRIQDVSDFGLELFLQDLNRRRDYDAACHGGFAGPDAAYLTAWLGRVTTELAARGYTLDHAGTFFRPDGRLVPSR
jgi:hypothetical protein